MVAGKTKMSEVLHPEEIRFCIRCGSPLVSRLRAGKTRPVCPSCNWTYFPDPKVAVVLVVVSARKVLLVQRANPPRQGYWSLPGGFLDAGEDPREAAARECLEETGLQVRITSLLEVTGRPIQKMGAHLVLYFRGEVIGGRLRAQDDAAQAAFFSPKALPPLAFDLPKKLHDWVK